MSASCLVNEPLWSSYLQVLLSRSSIQTFTVHHSEKGFYMTLQIAPFFATVLLVLFDYFAYWTPKTDCNKYMQTQTSIKSSRWEQLVKIFAPGYNCPLFSHKYEKFWHIHSLFVAAQAFSRLYLDVMLLPEWIRVALFDCKQAEKTDAREAVSEADPPCVRFQ